VQLSTDSVYVRDGITKWIHGWQKNGWKTAAKKPVKNDELWRELLAATKPHIIEWKWVKGHAGTRTTNASTGWRAMRRWRWRGRDERRRLPAEPAEVHVLTSAAVFAMIFVSFRAQPFSPQRGATSRPPAYGRLASAQRPPVRYPTRPRTPLRRAVGAARRPLPGSSPRRAPRLLRIETPAARL
jgi:hypothetical protein